MRGTRWLLACLALASGEYVASLAPEFAEAWPAAAAAAALVALFGYGLSIRGWRLAAMFLLGHSLFLFASVESERTYRLSPWLRGCAERRSRWYGGRGSAASWLAGRVRRELSSRAAVGLGREGETLALSRAILLGERARLPRRTRQMFVESGTMHVFAISGLHVMTVACVLYWLLRLAFVPHRFAGAAAVPILWGYVWAVGMPPSAVRAAIMASFYHAAPLFWRRPDGCMAWALAFLAVYLGNPLMIADVGCALSFTVMLSILLSLDCVRDVCCAWVKSLVVAFAAWAGGLPIAAHVFGRVTPGGLLANLALLPAAAVTVVSGALGIASSYVSESMAAHLGNMSVLFVKAMAGVAWVVAKMPGANIETGPWPTWACAAWYVAMISALWLVRWRIDLARRQMSTSTSTSLLLPFLSGSSSLLSLALAAFVCVVGR